MARIFDVDGWSGDTLWHDIVTETLYELHLEGRNDVSTRNIQRALWQWVGEGKTGGAWGNYTVERITRGLLSTLRDFGILTGAAKKRIAPVFVSLGASAYAAFDLPQDQPSASSLLE